MQKVDSHTTPERWQFRVIPQEEGLTLQQFLCRRKPSLSKDDARALICAGGVYVNRLRIRVPRVRVAAMEKIRVYPEAGAHQALDPDALKIAYRDENMIALIKPPLVPTVPTKQAARGSLSEALIAKLRHEGVVRPYVGALHRLDREASGLVLFSIRSALRKSLHQQLSSHAMLRRYHLRVPGHVQVPAQLHTQFHYHEGENARVEALADSREIEPEDRLPPDQACTNFRVLVHDECRDEPQTLIEATLHTGRTHQIRAHMAYLGLPILGDRRYGSSVDFSEPGIALCAVELQFWHAALQRDIKISGEKPTWSSAL